MKTPKPFVLIVSALLLAAVSQAAEVGPTYAVTNCKIIPVAGPAIEKGVIIIRDGLIETLGPEGKVMIPEDAEVIDASGLIAYPGLIDSHTSLFIELPREEAPQAPGRTTPEPQAEKRGQTPDLMAFKLLKPKKAAMESYHRAGVTTVLVAPHRGIYTGQSVLLNLNGEKPEAMVVKNPVALHIHFATERGGYPGSLMGTMAYLRQSFLDTQHYSSYQAQLAKSPRGLKRPEYDPFFETLVPYVVEKKPIVFTCNNQEDIKRALRLAEEFKLNAFLSGANEAWRVAGFLKKTRLPLFVALNFKPPLTSLYMNKEEELKAKAEKEIYPANAAHLVKEGIPFALTSFGLTDAANIWKNVREAVKAGLPKDEALKAMTIRPAEFLGVGHCLGSLEPGKIANIILTSGEIFEEKTQVEKAFVDGVLIKLEKKAAEAAQPAALNLSGSWKAIVAGPMGEMEMTTEIEQEGSQVKGSISSQMGKWEIGDGVLSGDDLTFTISATIMGQTMDLVFSGKATQDSIDGTISFGGGQASLRATRIPKAED